MNNHRIRGLAALIFFAVLAVGSVDAVALPPLGRDMDGLIESVDAQAQTFRLRPASDSQAITLAWNRRTRFVQSTRVVSAARLLAGAPVTVTYRAPFFGKPFATKVLFRTAGQ